jgi:hypothetical protein
VLFSHQLVDIAGEELDCAAAAYGGVEKQNDRLEAVELPGHNLAGPREHKLRLEHMMIHTG